MLIPDVSALFLQCFYSSINVALKYVVVHSYSQDVLNRSRIWSISSLSLRLYRKSMSFIEVFIAEPMIISLEDRNATTIIESLMFVFLLYLFPHTSFCNN